MKRQITYTPQELYVKDLMAKSGVSAWCLSRDYIVVAINGTGYGKHIDDMNKYLGLR